MKQISRIQAYVDPLKKLYYELKERVGIPEWDKLKIDQTQLFWETIKDKINNGELVNISIRGEVRTGKSTAGITIMQYGQDHLNHVKKGNPDKDLYDNIFSDQTEFIRFITLGEKNRFIMIDEFNTMAETGANASTENALYQHYTEMLV